METNNTVSPEARRISPRKNIGILMFALVVIYIVLSLIMSSFILELDPLTQLLASMLTVTLAAILIPTLIFIFSDRTKDDRFNLNPLPKNQILPCIFIGIGACFAALCLANIIDGIYTYFGADTSVTETPMPDLKQPINLIITVICVCIAPAICEELLCRSAVLYSLRSLGMRKAALWSGLYFALLHASFVSLPVYFLLGYLFGVIAYKTRSVYSTMTIHFVYNFTIIILSLLIPDSDSAAASQAAPGITSLDFWISVGIFAIIGAAFMAPALRVFFRKCKINDAQEASLHGMTEIEFTDEYNALCMPHARFGTGFIIAAFVILLLVSTAEITLL